jgi:hypothetical protein
MSEELRFVPPRVEFDPRLANELARFELATPVVLDDETYSLAGRPDPFNGYVRMLTPEGGILILYQDQDRSPFLLILRIFTWIMATGTGGWLLFIVNPLSLLNVFVVFPLLMLFNWLIVRRKFIVAHSVEIRPEGMIVDGEDIFYLRDIGGNWPELQMKDDDPDRMVICGICGTRFIEYMTANRLDENDRTPEVLAADLEAAMEQLWGRREVSFATEF